MRKGNRRNDSHNVSLALQHDPPESNNVKPKPGDHRGSDSAHKDKKQNVLELAGFGGDEGRTNSGEHAGGQMDDRWRMEEEERPSSCCKLDDLKRLSDCEENLGLIRFDGTHAVLVDVRRLHLSLPEQRREALRLHVSSLLCLSSRWSSYITVSA